MYDEPGRIIKGRAGRLIACAMRLDACVTPKSSRFSLKLVSIRCTMHCNEPRDVLSNTPVIQFVYGKCSGTRNSFLVCDAV